MPNLKLRDVEKSDVDLILSWENNPSFQVDNISMDYSIGDIFQLIEELKKPKKFKQLRYIIEEDEKAIGALDFFNLNFKSNSTEIGVLIADLNSRGKGFAKKSLHLGVEKVHQEFGIKLFKANVKLENNSSFFLFKNCGFQLIGERDSICIFEKYL